MFFFNFHNLKNLKRCECLTKRITLLNSDSIPCVGLFVTFRSESILIRIGTSTSMKSLQIHFFHFIYVISWMFFKWMKIQNQGEIKENTIMLRIIWAERERGLRGLSKINILEKQKTFIRGVHLGGEICKYV